MLVFFISYSQSFSFPLAQCFWDSPKSLCVLIVFFLLLLSNTTGWVYHSLSIQPLALRLFIFLVILNRSAMNIYEQFLYKLKSYFSGTNMQRRTVGSYDDYVFSFIRNCQTDYHISFLIAIYEHSGCFKFSPTPGIVSILGILIAVSDMPLLFRSNNYKWGNSTRLWEGVT